MDPTAVLILGALWFLLNLLTGGKKKPPRRTVPPPPRQSLPDATQREGSRLELVLRQFEQALDEASTVGRQERVGLPDDEDFEERESLEREPTIISLEEEVSRPSRQAYTQDQDAEDLVQRRIAAAAVRDSARTRADHLAFDQRIRKEPAEHTAAVRYGTQQLRDAVVWREILGPPVSMREEIPGS